MQDNFFDDMQPNIRKRLERFYNRDDAYKKSIEKEEKIFHHLQKIFTEEQFQMIEEYRSVSSATDHIREILAYKQGMKDLASMLDIKDS